MDHRNSYVCRKLICMALTGVLFSGDWHFMEKDERQKNDTAAGLPPVGRGVHVKHEGHLCFAYLDSEGKWRNYDNGDILEGRVCLRTDLRSQSDEP